MPKTTEEKLESATETIRSLKEQMARQQQEDAARKLQLSRYEQQRQFYTQERVKSEQKQAWLSRAHGRAMDLIRQYIDAHYNLYGEFPKFVPVPRVLFKELGFTNKVEFYHLNRNAEYHMWNRTHPLDFEMPTIHRISVAVVEID